MSVFKAIMLFLLAMILILAEYCYQTGDEIYAFFVLGKAILISTTFTYLNLK